MEEAIEEMKKLRDISRDALFLQINNARYHWSIKVLEFYYENNIKIIDWPLLLDNYTPIPRVMGYNLKKLEVYFSKIIPIPRPKINDLLILINFNNSSYKVNNI